MTATELIAPPYREVKAARSGASRVSVVVPTFNARAYVREAVCSLLEQTWRDLEVIVVDDASTDGSTDVLMDIGDPRLRIVRLERNVGLSGARNAAIALARGEYLALLDADDVALPRRIERQVAALEGRPNVGLAGCLVNKIDTASKVVCPASDGWKVSDAALKPVLLFKNPFTASSLMFRRSAMPEHGFRPIYSEDYCHTADIAERHDIALVREPLVNYRVSPDGIMGTKFEQVARDALGVQLRLLARIGLPESACDPRLLRSVMYMGITPGSAMTLDWLERVRRLLDASRAANEDSRIYGRDGMTEAVTRIWEMALAEAGRRGGLRLNFRSAGFLLSNSSPRYMSYYRVRALAHAVANIVRKHAHADAAPVS